MQHLLIVWVDGEGQSTVDRVDKIVVYLYILYTDPAINGFGSRSRRAPIYESN